MKYVFLLFIVSIGICHAQRDDKYSKALDSLLNKGEAGQKQLIDYLEQERRLVPKNESLLRSLGFTYLHIKQYDLAEKCYNEALKVNPKCARCYMNLARIQVDKKKIDKALELLDKANKLDKNDPHIYATRGNARELDNDKIGAMLDYDAAVRLKPNEAGWYLERGNYNLKQNYLSLALSDFKKAIELAPGIAHAFYLCSIVYNEQERYLESMELMQKAIRLDSTKPEYYFGLGGNQVVLNKYEDAYKSYSHHLLLDPKSPMGYLARADVSYRMEDMDGSCIDNARGLKLLLELEEPDTTLVNEARYTLSFHCDTSSPSFYYQRGVAFYNKENYQAAVQIYSKGLLKFSNNSMTLSFRANSYLKLKEYQKAINDYQAAIENKENVVKDIQLNQRHTALNKESIETYVAGFVGYMHFNCAEAKFGLGMNQEALKEINLAFAKSPNMQEFGKEGYYYLRANILTVLEKYEQALEDLNKSIEINPAIPDPYLNRALLKIRLSTAVKIKYRRYTGNLQQPPFDVQWSMETSKITKSNEAKASSALLDCLKATQLAPTMGYAFYISGMVKSVLGEADVCLDLLKAKNLGYPVEEEYVKKCIK